MHKGMTKGKYSLMLNPYTNIDDNLFDSNAASCETFEQVIKVSAIIPALDAAETIAETIASLQAQTFRHWEAIVVNDGSTDATAEIVTKLRDQDDRIRLISHAGRGVSAARNAGIEAARAEWLLFLDADDWLLPLHLESMLAALEADTGLDAVHCGWARVPPDGTYVFEEYHPGSGDMFPVLASSAVFAIHACVIRREMVRQMGGFDTSLRTCEDWDLWQRVARTGARFGLVKETLALYRMRRFSASQNGIQMTQDGLRVLGQGHTSDDRVILPLSQYAAGMPATLLAGRKFYFASWGAGLILGSGGDACSLLELLKSDCEPALDPWPIAETIFMATVLPDCKKPSDWAVFWDEIVERLDALLLALETQSKARNLARRVRIILENMVIKHAVGPRPFSIGTTYAIQVEITKPLDDIFPPPSAERVQCAVECDGVPLGIVELPVCDGLLSGYVLSDAIAAEFAWQILGRFFQRSIYPSLSINEEPDGVVVRRGDVILARGWQMRDPDIETALHDHVGWTVFLQELWGRPDLASDAFYHTRAVRETAVNRTLETELTIDVSEELPNLVVSGEVVAVMVTVGGVAIARVAVPVVNNKLTAHGLRVALTNAVGVELCRTAVREGILGRPISDVDTLQQRLACAAATATNRFDKSSTSPGLSWALDELIATAGPLLVLGQRHAPIGTSASRRAMLPVAAASMLVEIGAANNNNYLEIRPAATTLSPRYAVYAPELFSSSKRYLPGSEPSSPNGQRQAQLVEVNEYDLNHCETLCAERSNPQKYTMSRAQTKHGQALALIAKKPFKRALESVCAKGPLKLYQRLFRPKIIEIFQKIPSLLPASASTKFWLGSQPVLYSRPPVVTAKLPILMYHRISPNGSRPQARYCVTPESFEEQLNYLRDSGYYSVSPEVWQKAIETKQPLPGRAIFITFDDGYLDFASYAWPLLKKYGFGATVFLVTEEVGGYNQWDTAYGETVPLLGWKEIRQLHLEGVSFGSHSVTHSYLTALSSSDVVREGIQSRMILERELNMPIKSFAYPYGDVNPVVQHLIGACGYLFGFSCRPGLSHFQDPLLALSRIEVKGTDNFEQFVRQLN